MGIFPCIFPAIQRYERMRVQISPHNPDFYRLCREVLGELQRPEVELSPEFGEETRADLYVWDYTPGLKIPDKAGHSASKHLFLVHSKDLDEFREEFPIGQAAILLKPVTREVLRPFLVRTIALEDRPTSTVGSLRSDRDEMLQCLIEASLKLQEYDHGRTTFLARGIHDFRAPITAIDGYCGLLLSQDFGPLSNEQREILRRMQCSTKRLSRMVSAIFQLNIGRHIKRRLEIRKHDVLECLNQALYETNGLADAKHLSISVELEPEFRVLYFEQGQIEQLLVNLLDNACKFTPKRGQIDIRGYPFFWERRFLSSAAHPGYERRSQSTAVPNSYRIDLRNSGPGIPPQYLQSIFDDYTSYAAAPDLSGGGLGLAICRMIVTQHDGTIWAENAENGVIFSFVLPLYSQAPAQDNHKTNGVMGGQVGTASDRMSGPILFPT
jgi:signal transduction histidine kinase